MTAIFARWLGESPPDGWTAVGGMCPPTAVTKVTDGFSGWTLPSPVDRRAVDWR
jgi:hypothetical protein